MQSFKKEETMETLGQKFARVLSLEEANSVAGGRFNRPGNPICCVEGDGFETCGPDEICDDC